MITAAHGLSDATVEKITTVFAGFPEVRQAILFGSRAKGSFRPGSDIDLALVGPDIDWRVIGRIEMALDDLLIPYSFSLIELSEKTDAAIVAHIERVGQPFYQRHA